MYADATAITTVALVVASIVCVLPLVDLHRRRIMIGQNVIIGVLSSKAN